MATLPQSTDIPAGPSSSLKAEYEAAIAAYRQQLIDMDPTRKEYDALFLQHREIQTSFDTVNASIKSHRTTYQRHKQYVISLSNALLASNKALRSAPKPFSDVQVLTHATLLRDLRLASHTLIGMIIQDKHLEKSKEISFQLDQQHYEQCHEMFKVVDKDYRELDRLHEKVLDAEQKLGKRPECALLNGQCISCARNQERRVWTEGAVLAGGSGKGSGGKGKAAQGKQRLDDIVEEEEKREGADAGV